MPAAGLTVTAPGREIRAEDIPPDLGGVPVGHDE